MTEIIEIVGVNHQEHGPEFLQNLTEGMLITLEREPWNHVNPDAVVAKWITKTDIVKVGYVTDSDLEYVEPFFHKRNVIIIRFTGEKRTKSFTLDLDQAITFNPYVIKPKDSIFEDNSPLPYKLTPIVLKEEELMLHLVRQLEYDTDQLINRMPDDEVAKALTSEIDAILTRYIPLAKCSLSYECFESIVFVCHRFNRLMSIPAYREKFEMHIKKIVDIKNEYISHEGLDKVFKEQMKSMTYQMKAKNLFNNIADHVFINIDKPMLNEIQDLVLRIKEWLKIIPGRAASYLNDNPQKFIRALYDAKLPYMDLHLIYASMVTLDFCKQLLVYWVEHTNEEPSKVIHELTVKILGNIQEMHIAHEEVTSSK